MPFKEKSIEYYINLLTKLRRDYKNDGAPHKPILLLSIIGSIKSGFIKSNKIFITPELVGFFKKKWGALVTSKRHHCIFALPFYHMRSEPFWRLIPKTGYEKFFKSECGGKIRKN
jgi:putative restriction endonuclease